jgi:hypothetical protein
VTRTCDNCRRPVLDTDTVCWHCGWKLSPAAPSPKELEPQAVEEEQESTLEATPLTLIIFYGGLTFLIIIALLWLINSLAQSPTIFGESSQSSEWVTLTDPEQRFTIRVPTHWQWVFQDEIQAQPREGTLLENERWFPAAIAPLGSLVPEIEHIFTAGNESILLVIARSERLNRLTPEQTVASLTQESFPGLVIENARQAQNSAGEIVAIFTVTQENPALRCRQLLLPGPSTAYLAAACAAADDAAQFMDEFDLALDSLQLR